MSRPGLPMALGCLAVLVACSSTGHGTVTAVHDDDHATVKFGLTGRIAPGDRVAVVQSICRGRPAPGTGSRTYPDCHDHTVGHGVVISLPDSETAVVRVDPGTNVLPGMFVRAETSPAH